VPNQKGEGGEEKASIPSAYLRPIFTEQLAMDSEKAPSSPTCRAICHRWTDIVTRAASGHCQSFHYRAMVFSLCSRIPSTVSQSHKEKRWYKTWNINDDRRFFRGTPVLLTDTRESIWMRLLRSSRQSEPIVLGSHLPEAVLLISAKGC
jgi:hypothetical protein